MASQINLFEFVKYSWENSKELELIPDKNKFSNDLENLLDRIWLDRKRFSLSEDFYDKSKSTNQRFIDFKKNEIVPRNYIGTIHLRSSSADYTINLLPKLFHKENYDYTPKEIGSVFAHVLWWLSGSEKQNYFSIDSSMAAMESDFLEILVYMFSNYTLEVLSASSYNYYENKSEELETVKGQIEFSRYVKNYAVGNRHKVPCVFDSFQYDNQFNRIVKFVCTLLRDFTQKKQTKRNLEEILFILDEIDNYTVTAEDCDKVVLNPIYTEFKTILDNCKMFLSSLTIYKGKDDYTVFALLIPSESLFENFIFSTLRENLSDLMFKVSRSRPGRTHLVRQLPSLVANRYRMKNDIVVKLQDKTHIIFDTKYKRIYDTKSREEEDIDPYYNISQADIYQMVSYAVGSGISNIGLIFPQQLNVESHANIPTYEIDDAFTEGLVIRIHPFKVDIIHSNSLELDMNGKLENIFELTKLRLIQQLHDAIRTIMSF